MTGRARGLRSRPEWPRRFWRVVCLVGLVGLAEAATPAGIPAPAPVQVKPANKSVALGDWVAVSHFRQMVLYRTGYDYGVSLLRDSDGLYRMWWCGGNLASGVTDRILSAISLDGVSWSAPQIALLPAPLALVADPTVIRVNGWYWMYCTGTTRPDGTDNDIYLAVSTDGEHWSMYPSDESPTPVIASRASSPDLYGAGQPSALFLDGQFVIYFLDQTIPDGLYRAVSIDGITFSEPDWVMLVNDVDVKYNPTRGYYLMTRHGQFEELFSRACLHLSHDGLSFTPADNERFIHGPDVGDGFQLSSGISSDGSGLIGDRSKVIYSSGADDTPDAWDLYLSELYLFPKRAGHIYRFFGPATKAKDHFYATNPDSPANYEFERVAWQSPSGVEPGARPLFRLYNPQTEDHFYTADPMEKVQAMVWGYLDEGACGYILPACEPGSVPVFRLWRAETGDHFYTTDPAEQQWALSQSGYTAEGIAGFVHPPLTLPGDLTGEGDIRISDVSRLSQVLADMLWDQPWPGGDLDGDDRLTVVDLLMLVAIASD